MDNGPYKGMSDPERLQGKRELHISLIHAVQTGVSYEMNTWKPSPGDSEPATGPKHMKTGLNVSMSDHGALAGLLIKKGVISEEEYLDAICDNLAEEVKSYERLLTRRMGADITLG